MKVLVGVRSGNVSLRMANILETFQAAQSGDPKARIAIALATRESLFGKAVEQTFGINKQERETLEQIDSLYEKILDGWKTIINELTNTFGNQNKSIERIERAYYEIEVEMAKLRNPLFLRAMEIASTNEEEAKKHSTEAVSQIARYNRISSALSRNQKDRVMSRMADKLEEMAGMRPSSTKHNPLDAHVSAVVMKLCQLRIYSDRETADEMLGGIKGFVDTARSILSGDTEHGNQKVICFKSLYHAKALRDSLWNQHAMAEFSLETPQEFAEEVAECPYLLIHDTDTIKRFGEIANLVESREVTKAIVTNEQWISKSDNFRTLEEIVLELRDCPDRELVIELIEKLPLDIALEVVKKIKEHNEYLEFYKKYILNFEDEGLREFARLSFWGHVTVADRTKEGKTFHRKLEELVETLEDEYQRKEAACMLVMFSERIYLAGIGFEILELLPSKEAEQSQVALQAITEIQNDNLEEAERIVLEGMAKKKQLTEQRAATREVWERHPEAQGEELQILIRTYQRLHEVGIDPKYFAVIQKDGTETAVNVAKTINSLDDMLVGLLLRRTANRKMLVQIVQTEHGNGKISEKLSGLTGKTEDTEVLNQNLYSLMEDYKLNLDARMSGGMRRIVLIAGDKVSQSISEQLVREFPGIEIKVIGIAGGRTPYTRSYFSSTLQKGDQVIIGVSHMGHATSGTVMPICLEKGIPVVQTSQTNGKLIAEQIRSNGNGKGNK